MESSSFARLPPEIRNEIFELAFTSYGPAPLLGFDPSLTRTCHQIRTECLPMYYACNDFELNISGDETTLASVSLAMAMAPVIRKLEHSRLDLLQHIPRLHVNCATSTPRDERRYMTFWAHLWRTELVCDSLAKKGLKREQVLWNVRITARDNATASYIHQSSARRMEMEALRKVRWMWEVMAEV